MMLMTDRLRLVLLGFVAMTVSLPMAWISLGKLVLFVTGLVYLGARVMKANNDDSPNRLWTVKVILLIVAAFGTSLLFTDAPADIALQAFVKHSKLLAIVLFIVLIRTPKEAALVLWIFLVSQAFFIVTSWAMAAGVPIAWATRLDVPQYRYVVFSTYLDQTLIFAGTAAVFWHMRAQLGRYPWVWATLALAALVNNVFLQEGRTGYIASLVVLSLAIMWAVPQRLRLPTLVLAPLFLMAALYMGSSPVQKRVSLAIYEMQTYSATGTGQASSSGFRLQAWKRSVQAIAEEPVFGHGVGAWTTTVRRLEGERADEYFGTNLGSNAHQEYLMWGVELGVMGVLLFIGFIVAVIRDALTFSRPTSRATISVAAVIAVVCLFNASMYDALIGDYFCVTLGVLMAVGLREKTPISKPISVFDKGMHA